MTVTRNAPRRPRTPEIVLGHGHRPMTHYLAIFEQAGQRIVIEYIPLEGGGIEIVSVDIQRRPQTWQEQRAAYQRTA